MWKNTERLFSRDGHAQGGIVDVPIGISFTWCCLRNRIGPECHTPHLHWTDNKSNGVRETMKKGYLELCAGKKGRGVILRQADLVTPG